MNEMQIPPISTQLRWGLDQCGSARRFLLPAFKQWRVSVTSEMKRAGPSGADPWCSRTRKAQHLENLAVWCKNLPFLKEFDRPSPLRLLGVMMTSSRFFQALSALLVISSGCPQAVNGSGSLGSQVIALVCFPGSLHPCLTWVPSSCSLHMRRPCHRHSLPKCVHRCTCFLSTSSLFCVDCFPFSFHTSCHTLNRPSTDSVSPSLFFFRYT